MSHLHILNYTGQAKHQSFMFSTNKNLWQQPIDALIQHFMDKWTIAGVLVNSRWEVNRPVSHHLVFVLVTWWIGQEVLSTWIFI